MEFEIKKEEFKEHVKKEYEFIFQQKLALKKDMELAVKQNEEIRIGAGSC